MLNRISLFALLAIAAVCCGCNIVGPAVMVIEGPPTVPAQFELNPERPTIIFVDDRHNVLPKRSLRTVLANTTERVLLESELVAEGNLIDHRAAMRTAARESADDPLSVVEVGRRLGAEVVIYISFDSFTVTRDMVTVHPLSVANVSIYDTVENQKIFPSSEGAFSLRTSLPRKQQPLQMMSIAERSEVERELAAGVGLRLARLFFEYELDRSLTN